MSSRRLESNGQGRPSKTVRHRGARLAAWACLLAWPSFASLQETAGEGSGSILKIDHYVTQNSSAPSIEGQMSELYVRERVLPGTLSRTASFDGRVALFVHGAGTPAEVAFDVPYGDYSWMAYLAAAGYDVFSVDMTGYGRSTRPHVMSDPCNLAPDAQVALGLVGREGPCKPSYAAATTTIASDWDDIDRTVEYILDLRGIDRVSLFGWSLGGPRAGGYAAQHPDKVEKLVLLAPAYTRTASDGPPPESREVVAVTSQSRADFVANWDRQVGCENQYLPAVSATIWSEMLKSDPVGATWGPGIRRAPRTDVWGWNERAAARMRTPTLMIAGIYDAQVRPDRVRSLYDDIGADNKVLIDLGCASHNAMWETVHLSMFAASLEWLRDGTVNGMSTGIVRMGYR